MCVCGGGIQKSITDKGTALRAAGRNRGDQLSKFRENDRSTGHWVGGEYGVKTGRTMAEFAFTRVSLVECLGGCDQISHRLLLKHIVHTLLLGKIVTNSR